MTALHLLLKLLTEVKVLRTAYGSVGHHKRMELMRSIIGVADALVYTAKV